MKKLSNTEAQLKKSVAYKKVCIAQNFEMYLCQVKYVSLALSRSSHY